jgi:large subunit ribosomal protein L17
MRHGVDGRKFGRNTSHRVAMFKNMANSVILEEQVVTSVQKAKEARRVVDRLITLAKKGNDASRRLAFDRTRSHEVVKKLFTVLADRYKARNGGYTRVLKLADRRWGDAAEMAVLQLVDRAELKKGKQGKAPRAEGQSAEGGAAATQDPLARVRKMFAGKSRSTAAASSKEPKEAKATKAPKAEKAAKPAKKAAARKAPASEK